MEEVLTKLRIRTQKDIYRSYSHAKEKHRSALAGGYISANEKFITTLLSSLIQAYLDYLQERITPEELSTKLNEIYSVFEKMDNEEEEEKKEEIPEEIVKDNRWYVYSTRLERSYVDFWKPKESRKQLSVYSVKDDSQSETPVFSFYYVDKKVFSDLEDVVVKALEYFNGKNDKEKDGMYYRLLKLLLSFKVYEDARNLLKDIKKDEIVVRFLEDMGKLQEWLENIVYKTPYMLNKVNIKRILRLLDDRLRFVDWAFGIWLEEDNKQDEEKLLVPVLSKFLVGDKKLSLDEVVLKVYTKDELKQYSDMDDKDLVAQTLKDLQDESKEIGVDLLYWLKTVYDPQLNKRKKDKQAKQEKEEEDKRNEFLAKLDKFFGMYLREVLNGGKSLYRKPSKILHVGKYYKFKELARLNEISIQTQKVYMYVLYGDKQAGEDLVRLLNGQYCNKNNERVFTLKNNILHGKDTNKAEPIYICDMSFCVNLEDIKLIDIREVFLFYDELKWTEDVDIFPRLKKKVEKTLSDSEYSRKAFFFLLSASALFYALKLHAKSKSKEEEIKPLVFAVIDTSWGKDEQFTYKFWDMVKAYARFTAFPLQTLDTFRSKEGRFFLRSPLYSKLGVGLQNLLFSATRNIRKVDLNWDIKGFNIAQAWKKRELKVYIVVEHLSPKLFDYDENITCVFYEVFELLFKKHNNQINVSVKLLDIADKGVYKIPWFGETVGDIDRILKSLPADYVLLISYDKKIFERDIQYYRGYVRQIKTVLLQEQLRNITTKKKGKVREASAILLYRDNMVKFHQLLPTGDKLRANLGIHAVLPYALLKKFADNNLVSSELNIFWLDEKVQGNPGITDLFALSLISWLAFETDTASHPYVKPKWAPRRQGSFSLRIKVSSNYRTDIPFDITTTTMELAQLFKAFSELKKW